MDTFTQHWTSRWNLLSQISEPDWVSIVQFTQAFLPKIQFRWPALDCDMWYKAVNKFKPKAALGPDGFDKMDLKNMPRGSVQSLLDMFTQIEEDDLSWPVQLSFATLIGWPNARMLMMKIIFDPSLCFQCCFVCGPNYERDT